ncbi:MAG TPA: hypothetical protein VGO75_12895 [Gemmatimonadaceae bacterium]|nr:hypothetical protein [Gemmatimonadaceae bacterium]
MPGPTFCWGANGEGQLGLANEPTGSDWQLPQEVTGSSGIGFTALAAGGYHTCALTGSGAAYCWGYNIFYQVGDGTTETRRGPTLVHTPSGVSFAAISAGFWHTCGVTASGAAYCWGSNVEGALGDGTTTTPSEPVAVSAPVGVTFVSVSAGGGHTCGVTSTGVAYCWGENPYGGLGDGTTTASPAPVQVSAAGLSFSYVSAGDEHSCALTRSGVAYCWGRNDARQLGDGTDVSTNTPVRVAMPSGVTFATIGASSLRTCALTPLPEGAIYCWGPTPMLVPAPAGVSFSRLDVGKGHACALTPGGAAYCWGSGGALGNEFVPTSATPFPVSQ